MRLPILLLAAVSMWAADGPPKARLAEVEDAQPKSYRAELTLDPAKNTFSGVITIAFETPKPLGMLWLNQNKIVISSASIRSGGKDIPAAVVPGGSDFVGLRVPSNLPAGPAVATIHYTGSVNEKNTAGIFRENESGNWYILTQFEATDARAAFPCFDEPAYKTPWQITLHVPSAAAAISNTPVVSEKTAGATKTVVFGETKPLPSYLVAFGVGPFEFVNAGTAGKNKVPVRIVVPKGRAEEAKYAAEVTATILTRLEDYFGIPFPYEKSDQVAIPNAAGFGAMENPGMVTYDQNLLLADPKNDRINRQRTYASVAAHELAHQWFGDLVTTAWWDDIWLNEAFATWMERKLIAEWKPEWKTRVSDVADAQHAAAEDSLVSARMIRQQIRSKDDINNAFDNITYQKGATVIGMFENWMGPQEFRKGVQSYLNHYRFRATTAGDFLDSLSSSSGRNVTKAFSTFLNQVGVPLVSVALDCAKGAPSLHLEQKRFLPTGSKGSADQTWNLPICVRFGTGADGQTQCFLMTQPAETVALKEANSCPAWVQANDRAIGYYRVEYKGGLLDALTAGDVGKRLNAPERASLMGDASALSSSGRLSAAAALRLVEVFHDDPDQHVVSDAMAIALAPVADLVPPNLMENYQRFIAKNFGPRAHALGWNPKPGESDDAKLLRPGLLRLVATWGNDQQLASQARTLTDRWIADHSVLDPNLVASVLGTAAFYGDKTLMDRLLAEVAKSKNKQVRQSILAAFGHFRDPAAIEAGMNAVAGGSVPFMEGAGLLFNGQTDARTRAMPLRFLKGHFQQITSRMPTGGGFDFGAVLPRVGAGYCDLKSRNELKAYFQPLTTQYVGAPRALDQTIEAIDLCIAKKAAQSRSVADFLARY